jgi:glycerophosphoryl diester phosphodiesterase
MQFLAHRGLWRTPEERNTPAAIEGALSRGFGVETDLRDMADGLAIAHDPTDAKDFSVERFLESYRRLGPGLPLALNIKADGLRPMLKPLLTRYDVNNYFCFDMSVPETLAYSREGFRFFSRQSEYEPVPALYSQAHGVWMDQFDGDWVTPKAIRGHLEAGKQVALVSPELHRRPHLAAWRGLRDAGLGEVPELMLCTDFPEAAKEFFHG